ncbi:MAG TPA: DUF1614 domain-containing protein [Candidatus Nitrosotalea sp.]|nr:DUF1614 domain-containing protein [Candidatus Nitrosotalea sp.]
MSQAPTAGPSLHPPLSWPYMGLLGALLLLLLGLLQAGVVGVAYDRLGLSPGLGWGFLLLSIAGSGINIPVAAIEPRTALRPPQVVRRLGVAYAVPRAWRAGQTVIAVNLGGAVAPLLLCLYLTVHDNLGPSVLLALAAVVLYVHLVARPVTGVGIAVPGLLPPLIAAGAALLLGGPHVPAVAYVAGVLGCLVGADLMNLGRVADLGAPVASIGGAGTFDGIFLTGVMAVLIAGL